VQTLRQRIRRVLPNRKIEQVLFFLHNNTRPHISLRTREAITTTDWTVLSHPTYSADLAPSDYLHFAPVKDELGGRRLADDDELKLSVREELRRFSLILQDRRTSSHAKVEKCLDNGNFMEK
jgi:hypothetical protein